MRILHQMISQLHDGGDTRFVIATQQRLAIGSDQRVPQKLCELGCVLLTDNIPGKQRNISSFVTLDHLRFAMIPRGLWRRVQVRIEQNRWYGTGYGGRNRPPYQPMIVLQCVLNSHLTQLLHQHLAEQPLSAAARVVVGIRIGRRPDAHVLQKPIQQSVAVD